MATIPSRRQIFVRHCDPYETGEGLGSYARGSLYPLIRVASAFQWRILWHDQPGFGHQNQSRPFYEHDCRHLAEWLLLDHRNDRHTADGPSNGRSESVPTFQQLHTNNLVVVPIDLENDCRLGRILGYAGVLISSIHDFCEQHGEHKFFNLDHLSPALKGAKKEGDEDDGDTSHTMTILVSLNGRFQYQDDPGSDVVRFLHGRCNKWKMRDSHEHSITDDNDTKVTKIVRIAAHIRVPEDYCSQEWKDANSIDHVIETLEILQMTIQDLSTSDYDLQQQQGRRHHHQRFSLDIYTEDAFTKEDESKLMSLLEEKIAIGDVSATQSLSNPCLLPAPGDKQKHGIRLHRQTPLLETVQGMATADIFIPASSYLSAFAGFFQTSLIVLPNESTRRRQYFEPHLSEKYRQNFRTGSGVDKGLDARSSIGSVVTIPIVPVEDNEALKLALSGLLELKQ